MTRVADAMTWVADAMRGSRPRVLALGAVALSCGGTPDGGRPAASPLALLSVERIELPAGVVTDGLGPNFPALDGRCRRLAFESAGLVYVLDLETGSFELASRGSGGPPNQRSGLPALSADGLRVAFDSAASNLVPGPQNRHDHVFVRDLAAGWTRRVSVSSEGEQADDANLGLGGRVALSDDGRFVAFPSFASNLVPGDRNRRVDVFVHDLERGTTRRASVAAAGSEADGDSVWPALAADGWLVAFDSDAANLVDGDGNGARDVFVRDRRAGRTERVSRARGGGDPDGASALPDLSADGRFVAFASDAENLVAGDGNGARDVFVHDRRTGTTERVSRARGGGGADGPSDQPVLGADGRRVAFVSSASNLVAGDRNGLGDVFVADRATGDVVRASSAFAGGDADEESGGWGVALSGDGRCVAFGSYAANLVPGDDNHRGDLFLAHLR